MPDTAIMLDLDEDTRRILQHALEHWTRAVKGIVTRVEGMGYPLPMAVEDRKILEGGGDGKPGLVERLDPQASLFEGSTEGAGISLTDDEARFAFYAVRKHRERVDKLRKDLKDQDYETVEQEADLDRIGDHEEGEGLLGDLDLGWLDTPPDPDQTEIEA